MLYFLPVPVGGLRRQGATSPADDSGYLSAFSGYGKDTPLARPGEPKEVAPAFVLLASDEAGYISGALIPVTGGKPIL